MKKELSTTKNRGFLNRILGKEQFPSSLADEISIRSPYIVEDVQPMIDLIKAYHGFEKSSRDAEHTFIVREESFKCIDSAQKKGISPLTAAKILYNKNYTDSDFFINPLHDKLNEMVSKEIQEMNAKKEAFIKEMLIKKGYPELAEIKEIVRFPKINISVYDGWSYIFAYNGTKQGDFIVAIGPIEPDTKFDFSMAGAPEPTASCTTTYSFKWQDTDCSAVLIK